MMSPSDLLATLFLNAFQNVALAIIIERQNKLNFSDQCQTKFLLPRSQNEFYDLLTIPSCTSASVFCRQKLKQNIWKMILIFHVTIQIQILTDVLRAIKVLKEDEKYIIVGVSSSPIKRAEYETCKYDVNHHG